MWYFILPILPGSLTCFFSSQFKVDGDWFTWIDYGRFQELVREHERSGGAETFTAADYAARTPEWALFGSRERGFDPLDVRYQRKNKARDISGC